MKIVGKYDNEFSANLAKGMLESNGIEACLLNPNQAFITGTTIGIFSYELAVADEDYSAALKLLEASSNAE